MWTPSKSGLVRREGSEIGKGTVVVKFLQIVAEQSSGSYKNCGTTLACVVTEISLQWIVPSCDNMPFYPIDAAWRMSLPKGVKLPG